MLTLSDLERVAPALLPHRSATVRPVDWEQLRTTLGFEFPSDFREYSDHYWNLSFDDFLLIAGPEPGRENEFVEAVADRLEALALLDEDMMEGYRFYPDENGLYLWGTSDQGDCFFWRMSGPDPDLWPAVVFTRNSDWWEHDGGMLSLIVGLIDGSVEHKGLPPRPGPNPTVTL